MSRILITGGSGFIGTNLVQACAWKGHAVANVDVNPPRDRQLLDSWSRVDVRDRAALSAAMDRFHPEYVVHLAARTDLDGRSVADYDTNIAGVENLIACLEQYPPARVLFASSMFVCRLGHIPARDDEYCPHTVYGESKVEGERIVHQRAGDSYCWSIVRPTSIWGPWFDVPYKGFFTAVQRGLYAHPRNRIVRRSYGFVLNIVAQIESLMFGPIEKSKIHRRTFYLADYEPLDVKHWADLIAQSFGRGGARQIPMPVLRTAAKVGDILKRCGVRNPPLTSFRLKNLVTDAVFDLSPLKSICGESPYTLEQGVALTTAWMRAQETGHEGTFSSASSQTNVIAR